LACHLQVDADADPDPAYHFDADPDPTFLFDAAKLVQAVLLQSSGISCIGPTEYGVKIFQLLLAINRSQDSSQLKRDNISRPQENKIKLDFFQLREKMHFAYFPYTPVNLSFQPI
jgi:hypothetical protein